MSKKIFYNYNICYYKVYNRLSNWEYKEYILKFFVGYIVREEDKVKNCFIWIIFNLYWFYKNF